MAQSGAEAAQSPGPGPRTLAAPARAAPRSPPASVAECDRQLSDALTGTNAGTRRDELTRLLQQCRERFPQWTVPDRLRAPLEERLARP